MTNDDTPVKKKRKIKRVDAQSDIVSTHQSELDTHLSEYHKYKQLANEYEAKARLSQTLAVERMIWLESDVHPFTDERGQSYDAKLIQPERADIDEKALRERVSDEVWEKIIKISIDKTAVDRAVKDDLISMDTLMECVNLVPTKPYIKFNVPKNVAVEDTDNDQEEA